MKRIIPLILIIGFIAMSCKDTSKAPKALEKESMLDRAWNYYKANKCDSASAIFDSVVTEIDPADLEAHLGLGLSYTCLGYYTQAHSEFSLIYSPYVTPQDWELNLYVDASYRDTIGTTYVASPNAQFVSRYSIQFITPPTLTIIGGQWRLGKILRENNVFPSDTTDYLYLITEYGNEIKVKPKGSLERLIDDIDGYTDGLAYVDSFIAVVGGKLTLIDTIGPVLFVSSKKTGPSVDLDTPYIHSWLKHNDSVFVEMKVTAFRVPRRGLDVIPWLALAADAYAYYVEGTNIDRAASLALIAYWTRNLISSFPSRLQNIPGLSDGNEKKGLAAVYAQAKYKSGMLAGSVSMIRVFDPTWPALWTYTARSRAEIDTAVRWMRHEPKFRALGIKIDSVFYRR
jgi:hypothetical protein